MADESLSRILFPLDDVEGGPGSETAWAVELGSSLYRLDNVPFFAYGVSFGDVVEATLEYEFLTFRRVVGKSGNRTVRATAHDGESQVAQPVLDELVRLGCTYEGFNPRYIAVNVPPEIDLDRIASYLTSTGLRWEHADPTYEELHG